MSRWKQRFVCLKCAHSAWREVVTEPLSLAPQAATLMVRGVYCSMCNAVGKKFNDYTRLKTTGEFLAELSSDTGIPITELIQSFNGGDPYTQGSWGHSDVAIHLAQWRSPKPHSSKRVVDNFLCPIAPATRAGKCHI